MWDSKLKANELGVVNELSEYSSVSQKKTPLLSGNYQ